MNPISRLLPLLLAIVPLISYAATEKANSDELHALADIVVQVDTTDRWTILKPLPNSGGVPPVLTQRDFAGVLQRIPRKTNAVMVVFTKQLQAQETPDKTIERLHPFFHYFRFQRMIYAQATDAQNPPNLQIVRDTSNDRIQFKSLISESENRWVFYSPQGFSKPDGLQIFGYIYIDSEAGFTFHMSGMCKIATDGRLKQEENKELASTTIKHRLDADGLVAQLTPEDRKQLNLPDEPEWLAHYKTDPETVQHKIRWGYAYNHIAACEKALVYLESGYKQEPTNSKLIFELTYSYNALGRFKEATSVLESALRDSPKDFYLNREYAYALSHSENHAVTIKQYLKCIDLCPSDMMSDKAEAAFNLAQTYLRNNDAKKAREWYAKAKSWAPEKSQIGDFFKNNPNYGMN